MNSPKAIAIAKKLTVNQRRVMQKIHNAQRLEASDHASRGVLLRHLLLAYDQERGAEGLSGLGMEVWLALLSETVATPPPSRPKPKHERNAEGVALAWKEGRTMNLPHFRTDGREAWSYNLKIGDTDLRGRKILYNYTRDGGHFVSSTTSMHVGCLSRHADQIKSFNNNGKKKEKKK